VNADSLAQRQSQMLINILVAFARHYLFAAHQPDSLLLGLLDSCGASEHVRNAVRAVCCSE
jgi:hypothetical protein